MREETNEKESEILLERGLDCDTASWPLSKKWTMGDLLDLLPESVFLMDDDGWENDCSLQIRCDGNGAERRWHVMYVHHDYKEGTIVDLEFWRRELVYALVEATEWMLMNKPECIIKNNN